MADLRISELAALASGDLASGDLLPIADISASETKKITVTDFTGKAVTLIADATIPGAKILFGSSQVPGSALVDSGVTTAKLANDAVTADKLGNESTVDLVTTLPATGAFTGQLALDTDDLKVYCWDGSVWRSIKAAGSINAVSGSGTGIVNVSVTTSGDTVTIATTLDDTGAAAQFLAGPTGGSGAVGYRAIVGTDLPAPTTTTKGAVVINGEGLRMDASTLEIDNDVTANATHGVVTHTAKGLITGSRAITSADLPAATNSAKGAVIAGSGLAVSSGTLNHSNTVVAGTGTKVSFDAQGHITATSALADTDIPNISAVKLTSGTLDVARIGTNAITGTKLANEATVRFGGASQTTGIVTFPTAEYKGQYFWDASNGDLYLYDGSAWQPVTITSGELVYAGAYNASTNLVASITAAGSAAGLVVGAALPAASAGNNRYYVVVSVSGNGTSPAPTVALAPPDMILSNGATWDLIDVSNAIAGQTASNISFAPAGGIAATNVQTALQELDTEKLDKSGGTITGALEIGTAGSLVFEGSTADANETTLAVVNPTADRTITLPDITGIVVTTGDTGTVTNTMLAGSIADTKLSTIATADKVSISALNIDGGTDIGGALADADLFIVDDGATGTNRKSTVSRITDFAFGKVSGDITISSAGASAIGAGVIVNADVNASAGIAGTKINPDFGSQTVTTTGVFSIAAGTAALPSVAVTGDLNTGLYSPGADQVAISTGGTGRLFVDSTGRVAVGTSNPSKIFQVSDVAATSTTAQANTIARFVANGSNADANIQFSNGVNHSAIIGIVGSGANIYFAQDGTERMRITSDGKVGIGTSSPSALLHVQSGDIWAAGGNVLVGNTASTGTTGLVRFTTTAGVNYIQSGQNNTTSSAAPIVFGSINAGNEWARIDSSGRLLVGTSALKTANSGLFEVNGANMGLAAFQNNAFAYSYVFTKSRGTTLGTIVSSGDELGTIQFRGDDGSGGQGVAAAWIQGAVDGTPGTNDMPGRLVFSTTADGATSPTERARITSAGRFQLTGAYDNNITAVAALDIDCSAGNYFTKTINGASVFTVSNVPASRSYAFTLELTHTSGAITWFSGVVWPNSTAPTLTTGKVHLFMFVTDDGGTTWRASSLINY